MMATCLKALFWSFIFCFMIMTVWALLIVEVINPLMADIEPLQACQECMIATTSVMQANLLLFKTVIAGDSWGDIAVPVINAHPASAIIFMGSLLTLVFGVLNLIAARMNSQLSPRPASNPAQPHTAKSFAVPEQVAVVVDTFAEARNRDVLNLAEEMEFNLASRLWTSFCQDCNMLQIRGLQS